MEKKERKREIVEENRKKGQEKIKVECKGDLTI